MDTRRIDMQLARGTQVLARAQAGSPVLDAELLLAHVLGGTRALLRAHGERILDDAQQRRYAQLLERRAAGEPLAYLTGRREFWSLELAVSPAVLVPRPETELVVELALSLVASSPARVLDLGTGSGAIALALAHERPQWQVCATDVSAQALDVARANAHSLNITLELLEGAWYAPLKGRRFELIVSNPPYIAADDPALADPALRHEPQKALTPGPDAMADLATIVQGACGHLTHGGWLLLEHGATQAQEVQSALASQGFVEVRSHADLAGHLRVSAGRCA